MEDHLTMLLRRSLGIGTTEAISLTNEEWTAVYEEAARQSLLGVTFRAVEQLPENQRPPYDVLMSWAVEAQYIKQMNRRLTEACGRLTRLFAEQQRRTAILKGQANALMYPDVESRQPGDIDIWVEGGRESVILLLDKLGMMPKGERAVTYHHVHLPADENGVVVEIHFRPSSGNRNPLTNYRLQRWLEQEVVNTTRVEAGFCVPSMRFALAMQLSHIQRHFMSGGIGLRQLTDYYLLLCKSTEADRQAVAAKLRAFGLRHTAGALMWLLHEVFGMDESLMLCLPDGYRGAWMLREVRAGGNFGWYQKRSRHGIWARFFQGRLKQLKRIPFAPSEALWEIFFSWKFIITSIPERIRRRSWSLAPNNK